MLSILLIAQLLAPAGPGAWQNLGPMEGKRPEFLCDFVVDASGTPWAMARNLLYRRDGAKWQAVGGFSSGQYLTALWGGPKRGAWLTQRDARPHRGKLYRLDGEKPVFAADFYYDVAHEHPGLYVSRSGEVFNWSDRFIAHLAPEGWQSFESNVAKTRDQLQILDWGPKGPILFLHRYEGRGIRWDASGFDVVSGLETLPRGRQGRTLGVRGAPLGDDRALLFGYGGRELLLLELAPKLRVRPAKHVIRTERSLVFYDAWSAADGSVWLLVHRDRTSGYHFLRVDPEGAVTTVDRSFTSTWDNTRCSFYPDAMLQTGGGAMLFGLVRGGIRRLDGDVESVYDWKVGVEATRIDWLFETRDGTIYAAGHPHEVFRWQPGAEPDTRATSEWVEIVDRSRGAPLAAPDRALWAFPADRPGMCSRWDGERWKDWRIPFDAQAVHLRIADDQGGLILDLGRDLGAWRLEPEKMLRHASFRDALVAAVEAGARRFASNDLVGPVVDAKGRIWYARGERLHLYADGAWSSLSGVKAQAISREASFVTSGGLSRYRSGRLESTEPSETTKRPDPPSAWIYGPRNSRGTRLRLDFPADLRDRFLPLRFTASGEFRPFTWEEVNRGSTLKATEPHHRMSATVWADPNGLHWVRKEHGPLWRCIGRSPVELDGRGTPLRTLLWHCQRVGTDPRGRLWIYTGWQEGKARTFLQRGAGPAVILAEAAVQRGRWITGKLSGDATAIAFLGRLDAGPWQRVGQDGTLRLPILEPGRRTVNLELRGMGTMGQLGPPRNLTFDVDVRLPDTAWSEEPAERIEDLLWRPLLRGTWTGQEDHHDFEFSVNGGPWQRLPEHGHLALGDLPGPRGLRFRAVEDGLFADPEPLATTIEVAFDRASTIERMIVRVMDGDEDILELATLALAPVTRDALPLREKRDQILAELRRAREKGHPSSIAELEEIWKRLCALQQGLDTLP